MRPGLYGLKAAPQGLSVPRKGRSNGYTTNFPVGPVAFVAPASGRYKFHLWAGGYQGDGAGGGGSSGSYSETTRYLAFGQVVSGVVGAGGGSSNPTNSSLAFPDGTAVATNAPASLGSPGVSTGGDVNLPGSLGGSSTGGTNGGVGQGSGGGPAGVGDATATGGGAGAPAILPMRGGAGGSHSGTKEGRTPGAGGPGSSGSVGGGDGLLIIVRVA